MFLRCQYSDERLFSANHFRRLTLPEITNKNITRKTKQSYINAATSRGWWSKTAGEEFNNRMAEVSAVTEIRFCNSNDRLKRVL